MGLTRQDLITMINKYRTTRGSKALPSGSNLADFDEQDKYLTNLVRQSPTEDIQILTNEDAQNISRAINMLGGFETMGTVKETEKKIKRGEEILKVFDKQEQKLGQSVIPGLYSQTREKEAFSSLPEEVAYSRSIRTLGSFKKTYDDWIRKKDYVYLPAKDNEYYDKHKDLKAMYGTYGRESNSVYIGSLVREAKLTGPQQAKIASLWNQLQDINMRFAADKELYTTDYARIMGRYYEKARGSGSLADNTLINLGELTKKEQETVQQIEMFTQLTAQDEPLRQQSEAINELVRTFQVFNAEEARKAGGPSPAQKQNDDLASAKQRLQEGKGIAELSKDELRAISIAAGESGITPEQWIDNVTKAQAEQFDKIRGEEEASSAGNILQQRKEIYPEEMGEGEEATTEGQLDSVIMGAQSAAPLPQSVVTPLATAPAAAATLTTVAPTAAGASVAVTPAPVTTAAATAAAAIAVGVATTEAATSAVSGPVTVATTDELIQGQAGDKRVVVAQPAEEAYTFTDASGGISYTSDTTSTGGFETTTSTPELGDYQKLDDLHRRLLAQKQVHFRTDGQDLTLSSPMILEFITRGIADGSIDRDVAATYLSTLNSRRNQPVIAEYITALQTGQELPAPLTIAVGTEEEGEEEAAVTPAQAPAAPEGTHILKVVARRRGKAYEDYLSRATRNQERWQKVLTGEMSFFDFLAQQESLLGKSYPEMFADYLGKQAKVLGTNVKYGVMGFIGRKFEEWEFAQNTKTWFKKTGRDVKATYLNWERKHKRIHQIVSRFRIIPKADEKDKKKGIAGLVEAAAKAIVQIATATVQGLVTRVTTIVKGVTTGLRLPRTLINSPTSFWKKLTAADSGQVAEKVVGGAKKAIAGISKAVGVVRTGFEKVGVMMGEVASVIKGVTAPLGIAAQSLPMALIPGLAAGLFGGPVVGVAVGGVTFATNFIERFMRFDPTGILAIESKYAKYEWKGLGKLVNTVAGWVRAPYRALAAGYSPGLLEAKGRQNLLDDAMRKEIIQRKGIFTARHMALRAFNNAAMFGSIGSMIGSLFGAQYALIGAGVGGGLGLAGSLLSDTLRNKGWLSVAQKGGTGFWGLPIGDTFLNFANISMLGQELSVIQTKYHWNFGEYFKNEFSNPWAIGTRLGNWGLGLHGLMRLPQVIGTWFQSNIFTSFVGGTNVFSGIAAPATIGWLLSLGVLAAMGVPLTPIVIGSSLIGMAAGTTLAVVAPALIFGTIVSGPIGWLLMGGSALIGGILGGKFGYWLDQKLNGALNGAISMFGLAINGIQALFELFKILQGGLKNIGITNILTLLMAGSSLIATLNYLSDMGATNNCTTDEECPDSEGEGFISQGETDYLYYYDLNVLSGDKATHRDNIQRILSLLSEDPDFLETNFGDKKKYIYVGDTNDMYVNDDSVIIAISKKQLYSGSSISALVNQSTASITN